MSKFRSKQKITTLCVIISATHPNKPPPHTTSPTRYSLLFADEIRFNRNLRLSTYTSKPARTSWGGGEFNRSLCVCEREFYGVNGVQKAFR